MTDDSMQALIAETIRGLRQVHGLSEGQLAGRARITIRALKNLENGNPARPRTIERLARALGLTPMELYERAAPPRSAGSDLDNTVAAAPDRNN